MMHLERILVAFDERIWRKIITWGLARISLVELNEKLPALPLGLGNSLTLNGAKKARNALYLINLTTLGRAFVSLSGMPILSSR
jgi:hypothetical protein